MDTRYLVDAILNAPKAQQAAPVSRYGELAQALMQQAAPAFGMTPTPIPMDGSASFHQGWTTPAGQQRDVEQFRQQMRPPGMALGPSWLGMDVPLAQLVGSPAAKGIEDTTSLLTSFAPGISDAQAAYDALGFFGDAIGSAGRGEWDNIAPMMAMGLTAGAGALPGMPNAPRILRDNLGAMQPKATLFNTPGSKRTVWGSDGPREEVTPERFTLASTVEGIGDRSWTSIEEAEKALADEGWSIMSRGRDLYGRPILNLEHAETARTLREALDANNAKWAGAQPVFVRYGDLPPDGLSKNWADGTPEQGVSVFRGEMLPSGEVRVIPGSNQMGGSWLSLRGSGRPLYVVDGAEIGLGSDGEPLLSGARIVGGPR